MDKGKGIGFVFGLLVGALIGASVAILLAPQSGEETREILKEKTLDARRKMKEFADNFKDDAEEWVEKARKSLEETRTKLFAKGEEEGEPQEAEATSAE